MIRAIEWVDSEAPVIRLIDQTRLPKETVFIDVVETAQLVDAISRLVVRGAPALGAAGAYGVALAVWEGQEKEWTEEQVQIAINSIRQARPTAVNLAWGVQQVEGEVANGFEAVLRAASKVAKDDECANRELSRRGADWIVENYPKSKYRVITHCNTGALATTAWGTALGIVRELDERGLVEYVYVDETRPLLQGARLTSWELTQLGVAHKLQVDGAASSTILRGLVDFAVIGADRIAANGDTANKVGSVGLALAASRAGIPFLVAAPASTIDLQTKSGEDIEIELRTGEEVTEIGSSSIAPEGVSVFNPAFDVTPFDLISAIVTEKGIVNPSNQELAQLFKN